MRGWAVWAASLTVVLLYNPGAQPSVRFSQRGPQVLIPDVILCTITPICVLMGPRLASAGSSRPACHLIRTTCPRWANAERTIAAAV